jgi:hypothetical protein
MPLATRSWSRHRQVGLTVQLAAARMKAERRRVHQAASFPHPQVSRSVLAGAVQALNQETRDCVSIVTCVHHTATTLACADRQGGRRGAWHQVSWTAQLSVMRSLALYTAGIHGL